MVFVLFSLQLRLYFPCLTPFYICTVTHVSFKAIRKFDSRLVTLPDYSFKGLRMYAYFLDRFVSLTFCKDSILCRLVIFATTKGNGNIIFNNITSTVFTKPLKSCILINNRCTIEVRDFNRFSIFQL